MIFVMLGAMFIHDVYNIFEYGRPSYVVSSFIVCVIIDNVKSLLTLALVYCIVVRRFMYLEVNEHEYHDPNAEKIPKRENAIPKLKIFCLKFLESAPVESVSLIVIAIYAIFVLFWLVHEEFLGFQVDNLIMSSIDQIFLIIFLVEIFLKSFASNAMYLYDGFNLFDAFIVILSFILNMVDIIIKGLSVMRLIRVVVIVVRKISGQ